MINKYICLALICERLLEPQELLIYFIIIINDKIRYLLSHKYFIDYSRVKYSRASLKHNNKSYNIIQDTLLKHRPLLM